MTRRKLRSCCSLKLSRHSRIWHYLENFKGIRGKSKDDPSIGFNQRMHCVKEQSWLCYRVMFFMRGVIALCEGWSVFLFFSPHSRTSQPYAWWDDWVAVVSVICARSWTVAEDEAKERSKDAYSVRLCRIFSREYRVIFITWKIFKIEIDHIDWRK